MSYHPHVRCLWCGAEPGESCRNGDDEPTRTHLARRYQDLGDMARAERACRRAEVTMKSIDLVRKRRRR